jgi:uncharacterized membrane protein
MKHRSLLLLAVGALFACASNESPVDVESTSAAVTQPATTSTTTTTTAPPITTSPVGTTEVPAPPSSAPLLEYGAPLDLGVLPGGTKSLAADINNNGVIVGFSFVGLAEQYPVWWPDSAGGPQRLDGFLDLAFDQQGLANEINDAGQILVSAKPQAFVVDPILGSSVEVLPPFDNGFDVSDMNERGQVVGTGIVEWPPCDDCEPNPITRGFVWDLATGATTVLGVLDGAQSSTADGINDLGQVVGSSDGRPFVWSAATGALRELDRLPGGERAYIYALNNQDQAVGVSEYDDPAPGLQSHAALWNTSSGEIRDLGVLLPDIGQSYANGVNDSERVAVAGGGQSWILDLSSNALSELPNVTFGYSVSINDRAVVVGMSADRAAIWIPNQ